MFSPLSGNYHLLYTYIHIYIGTCTCHLSSIFLILTALFFLQTLSIFLSHIDGVKTKMNLQPNKSKTIFPHFALENWQQSCSILDHALRFKVKPHALRLEKVKRCIIVHFAVFVHSFATRCAHIAMWMAPFKLYGARKQLGNVSHSTNTTVGYCLLQPLTVVWLRALLPSNFVFSQIYFLVFLLLLL